MCVRLQKYSIYTSYIPEVRSLPSYVLIGRSKLPYEITFFCLKNISEPTLFSIDSPSPRLNLHQVPDFLMYSAVVA